MLGKLSWSAIPFNQPIPLITSMVVILIVISVLAWVTVEGVLALPLEASGSPASTTSGSA